MYGAQFSMDQTSDKMYESYMERIKLQTSDESVKYKTLVDENDIHNTVFTQDKVYPELKVASTNDDFFRNHLKSVINVLRDHLTEVKRVKEIFEQFRPIIEGNMRRTVIEFISHEGSALERMRDYAKILNELRVMRGLALKLPELVAFPMFEVGTSLVKKEISRRIEGYMVRILWNFENDLRVKLEEQCAKWRAIADEFMKELTTAAEVVAMDEYKNNFMEEEPLLQ